MALAAGLGAAGAPAPAAGEPAEGAGVRRAAVADDRLAAEAGGTLFLEILAGPAETSESLAHAFAGDAAEAPALRAANEGAEPASGTFYRIPFDVLSNADRRAVLSALYPEELPRSPLRFETDGEGPHALYDLRPGEALYSAVVVRFCGRLDPAEVNALAGRIAERSGIADVRRIPAGSAVRIPLDLLAPEFRPEGDPEREEAEAVVAASARHRLTRSAARLEGVHVILDAGHGGSDSGAVKGGLHEDEYAYDVMCRLRDVLRKQTAAQVTATIRDRSGGFVPLAGRIWSDRDEILLTDPPFDLRAPGSSRAGVNLRWRLANDLMGRLASAGVLPERVVFVSIHADSLHPEIRGAMIYVPGRDHPRGGGAGRTGGELQRSEGLSRALAREALKSLRARGIAVHPFLPIRGHVIRAGRRWVPAVLRATRVPHALLVEVANLGSPADRARIATSAFRQDVAEGIAEALVRYYARVEAPAGPAPEIARGAGAGGGRP